MFLLIMNIMDHMVNLRTRIGKNSVFPLPFEFTLNSPFFIDEFG